MTTDRLYLAAEVTRHVDWLDYYARVLDAELKGESLSDAMAERLRTIAQRLELLTQARDAE